MKANGAHAARIEGIPVMSACAEPLVIFARRPAAEWAADARAGCVPVSLHVVVGRNGWSISRWTHLFGSLNSLFLGKAAPIPPDHTHFFPTETTYLIAIPRSVYSSSW